MTDHQTTDTKRLRLVLRANAATSIIGGATALIAGPFVSRELGIDHVALTRVSGAGLIGFALIVLAIAEAGERRVLRDSLLVSLGDATWVVGSIAVVLSGVLTSTGNVVVALLALMVADFGATQMWLRSRALGATNRLHAAAV